MRSNTTCFLAQEARALLTRLAIVKPFALQITSVTAAAISSTAQRAIDGYLLQGRRNLREQVVAFLAWLEGSNGRLSSAEEAQRRFVLLRLRFNAVLSDLDLFADAITQRSEHETGIWLSGLDAFAADALHLGGGYYSEPPVICYLDRGPGAAIRRARTRMPTGGRNPVAIIRVPRERMVGSGIASSLVHEVGHQAAELLKLVPSFRPILLGMRKKGSAEAFAWLAWERWISEVVADFWSVAKLGITSTMGLMSVVSLPRGFVFRINLDDPHPSPWIRVKLSCAVGQALYPHPQWEHFARMWDAFYPPTQLDPRRFALFNALQASIPGFVALLTHHRPKSLRGLSLGEVLGVEERQPHRLMRLFQTWRRFPEQLRAAPESLVFAVLGQAKAYGVLNPVEESRLVSGLLSHWALRSTFGACVRCSRSRVFVGRTQKTIARAS